MVEPTQRKVPTIPEGVRFSVRLLKRIKSDEKTYEVGDVVRAERLPSGACILLDWQMSTGIGGVARAGVDFVLH